ncbi:MAG TPA: AmmeMemoRadiSam system protein A [Pyrinomonadaceae bacterium]|jgi:AmmeMemoRadiSam system protein A|nr:AmmeMemoRadiSam system protein A [Pyrinomonadaceae bacterium]
MSEELDMTDAARDADATAGTVPMQGGKSLTDEELLPALARATVETFVRDGRAPDDDDHTPPRPPASILSERAACFVSIKTDTGDLRGCIGTIEPARPTLAQELTANAINAATEDPRFPPVGAHELARLRYSVDVLSEPEPAQFEDLDPSTYGVIVEDERGMRRGLLLPDIEGIETAARQVEIAARKAGIPAGVPLRLYRFRVRRFREPERTTHDTDNKEQSR